MQKVRQLGNAVEEWHFGVVAVLALHSRCASTVVAAGFSLALRAAGSGEAKGAHSSTVHMVPRTRANMPYAVHRPLLGAFSPTHMPATPPTPPHHPHIVIPHPRRHPHHPRCCSSSPAWTPTLPPGRTGQAAPSPRPSQRLPPLSSSWRSRASSRRQRRGGRQTCQRTRDGLGWVGVVLWLGKRRGLQSARTGGAGCTAPE